MEDLESVKIHSVEHLLRASFTKSGRSQSRNPRILFHTTTVTRRRGAMPGFFRYMNEEDEEGRAEPTDTARDDSSPVGDEAPALAVETAATDDAVDCANTTMSQLFDVHALRYTWSFIAPHRAAVPSCCATGDVMVNTVAACSHHFLTAAGIDAKSTACGGGTGRARSWLLVERCCGSRESCCCCCFGTGGGCELRSESCSWALNCAPRCCIISCAIPIALTRADRSCVNFNSSTDKRKTSRCFSSIVTSCRKIVSVDGLAQSRAAIEPAGGAPAALSL